MADHAVSEPGGAIGASKQGPAWIWTLIRTAHPGPTLVLTTMMVLLTLAADLRGPRLVVLGLGVLAGELSIGWSNDLFDAERDAAAGRRDKPLAVGAIGRRPVAVAAVVSLAVGVVLCFVVAFLTGVINVIMMAAGWAYNARLKSTLASGLAYVVGFGAVPLLATSSNAAHPGTKPWTVLAAALLGLGGHFANALPDLATDRATDVRGLPQRVASAYGEQPVRVTAFVLLLAASGVVVFASGRSPGRLSLAGFAVAVLLALLGTRAAGRWIFRVALTVAGVDVILYALRAAGL